MDVVTGIIVTVVGGLILWAIIGLIRGLWRKHPAKKDSKQEPLDARAPDEGHDDTSVGARRVHRMVALRDKPWKPVYFVGSQLDIQNRGPETAIDVEFVGSESCFVAETSLPGGEVDGGAIVELRLAQTFGTERFVDVRWRWRSDPVNQVRREQRIDLGSTTDDSPPASNPTPPQAGSLADTLQTIRRPGPDFVPWTLELVTGHRYRLTNRMPTSARNVTVAADRTVLRPNVPSWAEIPPASSVSFVCQPAWGSSHEIEVSWDSAGHVDGRDRWTEVI